MAPFSVFWRRRERRLALRPARRFDARRDRCSRADGDGAARRISGAYRIFRLRRRLHRLRRLRLEPLSLGGRRFDDHLDLRRNARRPRLLALQRLSAAGAHAGFRGRRDFDARWAISRRLGGRSALDSGDDGISCRNRDSYRRFAGAGASGIALWTERGGRTSHGDLDKDRRREPLRADDRPRLTPVHLSMRMDQPAHSRRFDRARRRDRRGRSIRPCRQRRRSGRRLQGPLAAPCDGSKDLERAAPHLRPRRRRRGRRDGSDRRRFAILSERSRRVAGHRP